VHSLKSKRSKFEFDAPLKVHGMYRLTAVEIFMLYALYFLSAVELSTLTANNMMHYTRFRSFQPRRDIVLL